MGSPVALLALAGVVIAQVGVVLLEGDARALAAWNNAWWTLGGTAATVAAVAAARRLRGRRRRGWLAYAAGCGAWLAGTLVYLIQELVLGSPTPFPGPADLGYLLFPVGFAVGTFVYAGGRSPTVAPKLLGDLGVVAAACVVSFAVLLAPPAGSTTGDALYVATAFAWPILNATAFLFAVGMRARIAPRERTGPLTLIVVALGLHTAAGTVYGAAFLGHDYEPGTPLDAIWVLVMALVVAAAAAERPAPAAAAAHDASDESDLFDALLAPIAVFVTLLVLALSPHGVDAELAPVTIAGGAAIAGAMALRSWARLRLERAQHARILADQTEAAELRARLLHSERVGAIGALAGGAAHDFNNLLQGMIGVVEGARGEVAAGRAPTAELDELEALIANASDLTSRLLSLARRKDTGAATPVDAGAVARQIAGLVRRVVPRSIRVELEIEEDLPALRADVSALEMALLNLALNGRDAMADTGGRLTIRVARARAPGIADAIAFEIADEGRGIPTEILPRIFEPFFTTKEGGKGTGLGLPMVEAFANEHGGTVAVDSAPGRGTRFRIVLPSRRGAGDATGSLGGADVSVIVVGADDALALGLAAAVERVGYRARLTSTLGLAADELARERAAAILVDAGAAPRDDLRKFAADAGARVIVASSAPIEGLDVIRKPVDAGALESRLRGR